MYVSTPRSVYIASDADDSQADEAAHRGVNHTLGNLDQQDDANPFVGPKADSDRKPMAALRPMGFERGEVIDEVSLQTRVKV